MERDIQAILEGQAELPLWEPVGLGDAGVDNGLDDPVDGDDDLEAAGTTDQVVGNAAADVIGESLLGQPRADQGAQGDVADVVVVTGQIARNRWSLLASKVFVLLAWYRLYMTQ